MPFLFPFRKVGQALHTAFRRLSPPTFGLLDEDPFVVSSAIFGNIGADSFPLRKVSLAIIFASVVGILGNGAFGVRNLAQPSPLGVTADLLTLTALPFPALAAGNPDVLNRELVTTDTMCFHGWPTTGDILREGAGFEVVGINAVANAAQVVKGKALWNRPARQFVREPMGDMALSLEGHMAIAALVNHADPEPASSGLKNSLPESLIDRVRAHSQNQYAAAASILEWARSKASTTGIVN